MKVNLLSDHGMYVTAEDGGGREGELKDGRPAGLMTANRKEAKSWEEIDVEKLEGGHVALKVGESYACCENAEEDAKAGRNGIIVFNRPSPGPWETFKLWLNDDGTVSFESVARPTYFIKAHRFGNVTLEQSFFAGKPVDFPGGHEKFKPSQPLSGTGSRPGAGKVHGRLTVEKSNESNWFQNSLGRFDYREAGAFSIVGHCQRGRHDHVVDYLRRLSEREFTVVRVFVTLGGSYWNGYESGPQLPDLEAALDFVAKTADAHGLYVRFTLLGDLHMFLNQRNSREDFIHADKGAQVRVEGFVDWCAAVLAKYENVIIEIANEPSQIGLGRSYSWLGKLAGRVKGIAPGTIVNIGPKEGAESDAATFVVAPADFVSAHFERKTGFFRLEWVKRSGEMEVVDQDKIPTISGEPINFCDRRRDGHGHDIERSTMVAFAYGAVSRTRQYYCNFHFDDALWCEGWDAVTERCMAAFHRGLDAIPMVTGDKWRGHWSNDPWKNDIYPSADDEGLTRDHVLAGRGPMRVFGTHNFSVAFPVRTDWNPSNGLLPGRSVTLVDEEADGPVKVSVYAER